MKQPLNKSGAVSNAQEVRSEPLFDTLKLTAGAHANLKNRFFSTPIGGAVTEADTNMTLAGVLPTPNGFIVQGIKVVCMIQDRLDLGFIQQLLTKSFIKFSVSKKDYLTIPLDRVCGGAYIANLSNGKTDGTEYLAFQQYGEPCENGYNFADNKIVRIGPSESFALDLDATAATINLNSAVKLQVYLLGIRILDVR